TRPELIVRRLTHRLGYRFKLHDARLPGRPDLVFSGLRKVIFVHGCFWHRHHCRRGRFTPRTNSTYWSEKFINNRRRDRTNCRRLKARGWSVLVVWECQLSDLDVLSAMVIAFLEGEERVRANATDN